MPLGISSVKLRHFSGDSPFDVNLLGMHHLPRKKPFEEATPATPNLLAALKEDTLPGREMVSDPSGTRRPSSPDFAGSGVVPNLALPESLSSPLLTLEHSGYLQKENWLHEV